MWKWGRVVARMGGLKKRVEELSWRVRKGSERENAVWSTLEYLYGIS